MSLPVVPRQNLKPMKTVNDSEQRSLLCSLLANRIQRLGSPEYPDGDDNPSESPLSVLAYRTDTSCLTQRGRSGDASHQEGPRNNSGLSITHSDDSTEWSFFVQPQVRSVRRRLEVESHANHCEPLNPNVGKYSRELGTGAVLDGVLDPGLRCFLLAVRFEHSVPCRILAQQQLIDNKNDLGRHHRFQPRKFVQQAQIEPLYYHENKSLERFPGSSTVEHSAVNRELQFK